MPHIHEKIDFTVEVFVVFNNRVLLRLHDKYKKWLSVGGHIELDEDPNHAALREVKEEVGLDVILYAGNKLRFEDGEKYRELIPPVFMNRHRINEKHEHVTLTYFSSAKNDTITQGENERSENIRWFARDELSSPELGIEPHIQQYARWALAVLSAPESRVK